MGVTVSDFIFCLRATNTNEEGPCAQTILSHLNPEYVPGLFSFSVILILLGVDPNGQHSLAISLSDPNEEAVAHLSAEIPPIVGLEDKGIPAEYTGINVAIDFNNVNFKRSGLYTMTVQLDGSEVESKSIYVRGKNE